MTDPKCDKCGAEITTGMMAAFCDKREQCEFWPEPHETGALELVTELWEESHSEAES